ncbi:hypothetical protein [Streptomyces sp. NPDC046939]|uniref:hypothetical protein n=1 Tax=Streptomyces sp. NPDC046939 TaxID=3155376 RepID=UPI0033CA051E
MTDSGNYAARAAALRETAKWVAAIFAGAGVILFSGLSFTNIEKVAASDYWPVPVLLAAIPVCAATVAVHAAARMISKGPPDLRSLLPRLARGEGSQAVGGEVPVPGGTETYDEPLRSKVEKYSPATVATFGSIEAFENHVVEARKRIRTAQKAYDARRTPDNLRELDAGRGTLAGLQEGVRDLLLCAEFIQTEEEYARIRKRLLVATITAVLAAALSGVAAAKMTPAPTDRAGAAAITHPLGVRVYLQGSHGHPVCPVQDGQEATAIGGTLAAPLLVLPATAPAREAPSRCHRPWRWEPASDAVVIVPQGTDGGNE